MKKLRLRHLKYFAALPREHRLALVSAMWMIPAFAILLRVLGFRRCERLACGAGFDCQPRTAATYAPYARLVLWAARYGIWPGNCLSRSLTLCRLMRNRFVNASIQIGVRRGTSGLEAHAWVEVDGVPVNDAADIAIRFQPIYSGELPRAQIV